MITAHDRNAHFEGQVNKIDIGYKASWTAFTAEATLERTECDARLFKNESDALAWIDAEAANRGFEPLTPVQTPENAKRI